MANTSQTIFQRLGTIFSGRNSVSPIMTKLPPTFDSVASNQVIQQKIEMITKEN